MSLGSISRSYKLHMITDLETLCCAQSKPCQRRDMAGSYQGHRSTMVDNFEKSSRNMKANKGVFQQN